MTFLYILIILLVLNVLLFKFSCNKIPKDCGTQHKKKNRTIMKLVREKGK